MVTASPGRGRAAELKGRPRELGCFDRLVGAVRAGESQALVLAGEAGVGKTALPDYVAEHASGCRVVRATGVQSEMELAFAGLEQLCKPLLDHLARLPGPQREALQTAFGLSAGAAPDRFLVRGRPGPVPGRPGRAEPAVRSSRGAAADLPGP